MSLYDDASLIMFPSGYKEDKIYSLKPTDGSGDLTFTRASTATRVNAEGLIEASPYNLTTYSEEFDNAAWTKGANLSVTANNITSPNGTLTADKIINNATDNVFIFQLSNTSAVQFNFSIYAKKGLNKYYGISLCSETLQATSRYQPVFNLDNGTVQAVNQSGSNEINTSYSINEVVNGWYKISINVTFAAGSDNCYVVMQSSNNTSYNPAAGNLDWVNSTVGDYYLWGAQLNTGATAKPYFPTTDRLNVPRIDYTGGGCGKLLLESQRTNLINFSEQINNAYWTPNGATISANSTIAPDGTISMDRLTETATSGNHSVGSTAVTIFSNQVRTNSVFVKKGNVRYIQLISNAFSDSSCSAIFDLDTKTVTNFRANSAAGPIFAYVNSGVEDYGNGILRLFLTNTSTFDNTTFHINHSNVATFAAGTLTDGFITYNGSASSFTDIWGAQVEVGSYVSSYIPTLSNSVTRLVDAAFKTGISSLIGQTQGTILWDVQIDTAVATGNEAILNIDNGSFGNTIYLIKGSTGTITGEMYLVSVLQASFTLSGISAGNYKIAFAYAGNNTAMFVNGVQVGTTDTSCVVPAMSRIQLGNGVLGASTDKTAQLILFPTRLTNTQLATLTTI